jgi:hypothetical protein
LRARSLLGEATAVAGQLHTLAERLGVAEIAVLTTLAEPQARIDSYRLLAKAWGLAAEAETLAAE